MDLAQYFFGAIKDFKLTQVKRVQGNIHEATITLKHVNGIIGELFVSWDVPTASKCREIRVSLRDGSSIMGDFFNKSLFLNDAPISCHVPMWVRSDNNQIKDEIVDFLAYCMSASSENEVFKPLLNVNEVEVSVKIIEMLLKQSKNFVEEENLGHTKAII